MARTTLDQQDKHRAALVAAARALFLSQGFDETTNEEIAAKAELTRGALHHQFGDKRGLFVAVFEEEVLRLSKRLYAGVMAGAAHTLDEVEEGAERLFAALLEPEARTILLKLGPAVLGYSRWRGLLDPATLALIEHALGHWADEGLIGHDEIRPLAIALLGAALTSVMSVPVTAERGNYIETAGKTLREMARAVRLAREGRRECAKISS